MFSIIFGIIIVFGFDSFPQQSYETRWLFVFAIAFIIQLGGIKQYIYDLNKTIKKIGNVK